MLAFLVGWGVFWLLVWVGLFVLGCATKDEKTIGFGFIMTAVSSFYLIAVAIGALLS